MFRMLLIFPGRVRVFVSSQSRVPGLAFSLRIGLSPAVAAAAPLTPAVNARLAAAVCFRKLRRLRPEFGSGFIDFSVCALAVFARRGAAEVVGGDEEDVGFACRVGEPRTTQNTQ